MAGDLGYAVGLHRRNPPEVAGTFRTPDHDKSPLEGLCWGLYHVFGDGRWGYIRRYEVDEQMKNYLQNRTARE